MNAVQSPTVVDKLNDSTAVSPKKIKLYIVEEQEILQEAYKSAFPAETTIEVMGVSSSATVDIILSMLAATQPDALLLGIKMLQPSTVKQLVIIREQFPDIGIVILSTLYDIQGIKHLREFTRRSSKGCAILLKHSIDRIGQLAQVVHSVTQGQVILDSVVMEGLISNTEANTVLLKELSHRELEVLSWMAKGYRNGTIAEMLCVDPKTIERHINAIYSKLSNVTDSKDPRVNSIMLYLKATGQLP
ncbi:MAG: response regulator transcription factor [Dehalococcoidia bacterium]|nr:response regulator transcription factor [Dehalococcoidia bacterium]